MTLKIGITGYKGRIGSLLVQELESSGLGRGELCWRL